MKHKINAKKLAHLNFCTHNRDFPGSEHAPPAPLHDSFEAPPLHQSIKSSMYLKRVIIPYKSCISIIIFMSCDGPQGSPCTSSIYSVYFLYITVSPSWMSMYISEISLSVCTFQEFSVELSKINTFLACISITSKRSVCTHLLLSSSKMKSQCALLTYLYVIV